MDELNQEINQQLAQNKLKVEKAQTAIVDATIIQTAGGKLKKAIEVSEKSENQEQPQVQVTDSPASKDTDAKWTIKSGHWYLGYKLHARTDAEGFIEQIHVTPANQVDVKKGLAKVRYRVEQRFAILHRLFKCKRASYFGLEKVKGQMGLKVMCLNLLKAANKLRLIVPIAA